MGQSQWTAFSSKCVASTGCCQQNYADVGTIKLESVPVPESPVNWDNLQKNGGGRQSNTTGITISSDSPQHIHRDFENGSDAERLEDRKATGFVYKNALPDIPDEEEFSDGTGARPEFGDTLSERQRQEKELATPEEEPSQGKSKRHSIADELEAGMYDNMNFSCQAVPLPRGLSGAAKVETKVLCVVLNKERGKLGFHTDLHNEDALVISKIEKGALADWNGGRQEGFRVTVGDSISSVNNTLGDPKHLQDMITKYISLKLEIKTHREFEVRIQKTKGARLGLDVKAKKKNTTLPIVRLHQDGLVAHWNAERHSSDPTQRVTEGDRVVAVNGEGGSAEFLKKQLSSKAGSMVLTIARVIRS